ncbi:MAG: hypothetical protein ACEQSK_12535, partial [Sphingomonadaceae bacterium]
MNANILQTNTRTLPVLLFFLPVVSTTHTTLLLSATDAGDTTGLSGQDHRNTAAVVFFGIIP